MGDCCAKIIKNEAIDNGDIVFTSAPNYASVTIERAEVSDSDISIEEQEFRQRTRQIRSTDRIVNVTFTLP